jgi:ATP-dependent DNA ligase
MNTVRLENTQQGHSKFYEFQGTQTNNRYTVNAIYGRIGQTGQISLIYDGISKTEAEKEFEKKKSEKLKKGYIVVSRNGNSVKPAAEEKKNADVPIIWPMNCQGVKNEEHLKQLLNDDNYIAQEKLDGMRAIVHVTPSGLRIFSRSAGVADPTRPLEKTSALPHLSALQFPEMVGTILDCEILARGLDCAKLSGTIHKKDVSDNRTVKLFIFDILSIKGTDLTNRTLLQRLSWFESIRKKIVSPYIIFLPWANTSKDKHDLYQRIIKQNGEGVVLKNLYATYIQGARPSGNWYKAKKSMTIDAVILGFTQGQGKYNTRIGAIIFGQYVSTPKGWDLKELGKASGMTDSQRTEFTKNCDFYVGKVVTIKGMERLRSGSIRHPQFVAIRSDKNANQCRWYEGEQ